MKEQKRTIIRIGLISVLMCILCTPLVTAMDPTPWGAPVLVSPNSGTKLSHWPRATTLTWQPVTGAVSYRVDYQYKDGDVWVTHGGSPATVTGINNASYTFNFVGDQPGRWRVSAYDGSIYSKPSAWWTFSYSTRGEMPTPVLTSPADGEEFHHYPRTLTLSWKPIPGADKYRVEVEYYDTDWRPWVNTTVVSADPFLNAYYTFNFVGAQPGRWRVTALSSTVDGVVHPASTPSAWRTFSFDI